MLQWNLYDTCACKSCITSFCTSLLPRRKSSKVVDSLETRKTVRRWTINVVLIHSLKWETYSKESYNDPDIVPCANRRGMRTLYLTFVSWWTYPTPGRSLTTLRSSCFNNGAEPTPERSRICGVPRVPLLSTTIFLALTIVSLSSPACARFLAGTYATPTAFVPSKMTRETRAFVRK